VPFEDFGVPVPGEAMVILVAVLGAIIGAIVALVAIVITRRVRHARQRGDAAHSA
jgi:hypothetical protein